MPTASQRPTMEIRAAEPSDAEAVRRVHRASIEGLGPAAYDPEQVEAWASGCESADYAATIADEDAYVAVAERGGAVVGFSSLSLDPSSDDEPTASAGVDAEVTAVYVHPSVAREGIGTALLADLERTARERDRRRLRLSSSLVAVPFYERHGYERIEARTHEFSGHCSTGVEGGVVEMRKELGGQEG